MEGSINAVMIIWFVLPKLEEDSFFISFAYKNSSKILSMNYAKN